MSQPPHGGPARASDRPDGAAPAEAGTGEGEPRSLLDRRTLLGRGLWLGAVGLGGPALLAACDVDDDESAAGAGDPDANGASDDGAADDGGADDETADDETADDETDATVLVGDVVDFALSSAEWTGPFGFVTFRLHRALVDGGDVYYIQTDASDEDRARDEGLVPVPKVASLLEEELTAGLYRFENGADDQPDVLSTEPGRDDYTPAMHLYRVTWEGEPRVLSSVDEIREAAQADELTVDDTNAVYNISVVKWSDGELAADTDERTEYLGPGQLLEPPDTEVMEVTFKLHECFPSTRYIVTDTDFEPAAGNMAVVQSPALEGATEADATGRTNVFANGFEGPGPMGFQPSVFDTVAGDPEWSPYWTHWTYEWAEDAEPRVLRTEQEIHQARDDDELIEHAGTPPSPGTFVVNCPVPILADVEFEA